MSDEKTCCDGSAETETCEAPKEPKAILIQRMCKEQVKENRDKVEMRVVDGLVEEEIAKRTLLLRKALDKRDDLQKEFNKIKPDQVSFSFDGDGQKKKSETWSPDQIAKQEKSLKAIAKLDKAIDKAITDADYSELQKS